MIVTPVLHLFLPVTTLMIKDTPLMPNFIKNLRHTQTETPQIGYALKAVYIL